MGKKPVIMVVLLLILITTLGAMRMMQNENDGKIKAHADKRQPDDKDLRARQNARDDMVIPTIVINEYGVTITFPVPVQYTVICRLASDHHIQQVFNGFTEDDRNIQLLKGQLQPGLWLLRMEYSAQNKNYLFEGEMMMP